MARLFADPFAALFNFQRALEASRTSDWLGRGMSGRGSYPLLNVFRQEDDFVVVAELPGIRREDVDIQIQGNKVRISGKKDIQFPEGASLHRREREVGSFDRTVTIPVEVDVDRVQAEYKNGVLALLLPRAERDKPKTITIN